MEYANTVWDPHDRQDINSIERVQRRAARFVKSDYGRTSSVTEMMKDLKWRSLQERRCVTRLTMLHKILNNQTAVQMPPHINIPEETTRRGRHSHHLNIPRAATNGYQYSFFPRTIRCWNTLPSELTSVNQHQTIQSSLINLIEAGKIKVANPKAPGIRPRLGSCPPSWQLLILY